MWARPDESYQTREPSSYSGPGSRAGKESERNELEDGETNVDPETDRKKGHKMGEF